MKTAATRTIFIALLASVSVLTPALSAYAQSSDGYNYSIIRPEPGTAQEPWLPPTYHSPRGTPEGIVTPHVSREPPPLAGTLRPESTYVPQTGQYLPNLPSGPGSGIGGAQTSQDRAIGCAGQAGVYGAQTGNPQAYVGGCINQ